MRKIRKYLEKGSTEVFAFTALAPVMVILFALLVTIVQSGSLKEKLEYTTYVAGRAAVVSETYKDAKQNALKVAKADLDSYGADYEDLKVTLSYASGKKWKKGSYITCEVSVKFKGDNKKSFSLTMAVEKPDKYNDTSRGGGV